MFEFLIQREDFVMTHPYHEDYVVLPTRPTIRLDNKNVERDIEYRQKYEDTSTSR